MDNYQYDEELDVIDFINQVVIKNIIKIIVVGLLIGGLGFAYARYDYSKKVSAVENLIVDRDTSNTGISKIDLLKVEDYVCAIADYNVLTDNYGDTPLRQLVNSDSLYVRKLFVRYEENGSKFIRDRIADYVTSIDFFDKLHVEFEKSGSLIAHTDPLLLSDVISVSNVYFDENNSSQYFYVSLLCDNKDISNALTTCLTDKISQLSSDVMCEDYLSETDRTYVLSLINQKGIELNDVATNLSKTRADFNEIQSMYCDALMNSGTVAKTNSKRNLKYGLFGFAVGSFAICALYGIMYLLSDKVQTVGDVDILPIKMYGFVDNDKNANDDILNVQSIVSRMELDIEKYSINKVVFATTLNKDDVLAVVEKMNKVSGLETSFYGCSLNNPDFIKECVGNVLVVYVEKVKLSKKTDIKSAIKFCSEFDVPCYGIVAIK